MDVVVIIIVEIPYLNNRYYHTDGIFHILETMYVMEILHTVVIDVHAHFKCTLYKDTQIFEFSDAILQILI